MTPTAPVQIVIFGLTGDLARKKLLPALYQLTAQGLLPAATQIVGVTRRDIAAAEVLAGLRDEPAYDPAVLQRLTAMVTMLKMDLDDPAGYTRLKQLLDDTEEASGQCSHRLLYLSMPPQVFAPVITRLGQAGLAAGCPHGSGHSRLLIEKPFGYDLASAEELVKIIAAQFKEDQIFRIDHYVAKDTAQHILAFRRNHPRFEAVWNHQFITSITVTATETIGAEGRLSYDGTGALRDVIQNHLLQLLTLVTMALPAADSAAASHAVKLDLLKAIPAIAPDQAVRGQYTGYRTEVNQPASITETFAAVHLGINQPRWQGVPVTIQTGKMLDQKVTEVVIQLKASVAAAVVMRIDPAEGISLSFKPDDPGLPPELAAAAASFSPIRHTGRRPDAYERVLSEAIRGDRTLFTTSAETLECWRIINTVVREWTKSDTGLTTYKPGTPVAELSAAIQPERSGRTKR
jgi:glucose-6-phosphate 1-dehydrogenase